MSVAMPRRTPRHRLELLSQPDARLTRPARRAADPGPVAIPAGAALLGAAVAWVVAGPVAAILAGTYGCLAVRAALRSMAERRLVALRRAAVEAVGGLAADLRAGLPAVTALAEARPALNAGDEPTVARGAVLVDVAWQVAGRLGAPLADLLDRVDADLRAADRLGVEVAAQTAGARASGWLLAGLPAAGVGLGYAIGGDPLGVLLHTPVGAACAVAALVLQCGGLTWTALLCRRPLP